MKEEQKQQEDEKEAPENLIRPSLLKSIPASKHMSSAGIIKSLLKKTKTEVKGIERAKIAARSKAMKKIALLTRSQKTPNPLIP